MVVDQSSYIAKYSFDKLMAEDSVSGVVSYQESEPNQLIVGGRYALYIVDRGDKIQILVDDNEGHLDMSQRVLRKLNNIPQSYRDVIDLIGLEREMGVTLDVLLKRQPNSSGRVQDRDKLSLAVCDTAIEPLIKLLLKR